MTKMVWIIGAVVVVGIGMAAGFVFAGSRGPSVIAAESAKGSGTESVVVESTRESTQQVADDLKSVPEIAMPAVSSEEEEGPFVIASLDELFANAATYSKKEVVVRGTIVTQCISGCTFSLEDGTGVVAVDLIDDALDNVLDGGSIGRQVEVRGTVEMSPQVVIILEEPDDWNYLD